MLRLNFKKNIPSHFRLTAGVAKPQVVFHKLLTDFAVPSWTVPSSISGHLDASTRQTAVPVRSTPTLSSSPHAAQSTSSRLLLFHRKHILATLMVLSPLFPDHHCVSQPRTGQCPSAPSLRVLDALRKPFTGALREMNQTSAYPPVLPHFDSRFLTGTSDTTSMNILPSLPPDAAPEFRRLTVAAPLTQNR